MEPEPITHQTDQYLFTVKLEADTLLLQLNAKGEITARRRYISADLPEKIQAFGDLRKVHQYFQDARNFEIDLQSATVVAFVF